jgi:NAD(P)H-dependent flavin oxidoreductase YrpB (nitropropane dioxygenase family)
METTSLATPLCRRLGITVPVVQAPVGPSATAELVAAVGAAGGLGMLSVTWTPPELVADQLSAVREHGDFVFGVNVVLDFPVKDQLEAALAAGAGIVSTCLGDPASVSDTIHAAGALHMHTVGSVRQALRAIESGVDVVVAQGWEAGGHLSGVIATLPLVPAVVDAVAPVPVIAAGGIADGRGLAAALVLGAQAAWIGTRFLVAHEAATHDVYRRAVLAADATDAVQTTCFSLDWADPEAPHRVLRNSTLDAWEDAGKPEPPNRPGEGDVMATDPREQHGRYRAVQPLPDMAGDLEGMAMFAGQSSGLVRAGAPAEQIVKEIVAEARAVLSAASAA